VCVCVCVCVCARVCVSVYASDNDVEAFMTGLMTLKL
jgi:selenocysteine lyase/cysteine desulfurase